MNKLIISISFFLFSTIVSNAQIDSVLISQAKFKDSTFNNLHAGSAFLLKYKNKVYGITAKHVLFFAKTNSMKTISFNNDLKSWEFVSKTSPHKKVLAGKLINEDKNEILEMPPKGDWLIFEIEGKVPKDIAVYLLKEEPLKTDESVYFLGYPYNTKEPIHVKGTYIGLTEDNNLRLDVPKGKYNGCSGGPVLDSQGKLVGIVSMGYFNKTENKMIFEPASLDYFKEVVDKNNE
jgi:hypothetical protein